MSADYVEIYRRRARALAPRGWLDDATSGTYLGAHGAEVGRTFNLWRESVKARYASTAPEDGLYRVGEQRQIERAPEETATAYRARLLRSFEIHSERTTDDGYRNALEPIGVNPAVVHVWNHYEVGVGVHWSLVYIMIDSRDGPFGPAPECDDSEVCDSGILCDVSGLTVNMLTYVRRTIRRYKWAGAYPVGIWIILAGQCCDMSLLCDSSIECDSGTNDTAIIPLGKVTEQENIYWNAGPAKCDGGVTCDNVFYE